MRSPVRICLVGASGRMGVEIASAAAQLASRERDLRIVGGIVAPDDKALGTVLPGIEHPLSAGWQEVYRDVNVLVDFSSPKGTTLALNLARERGLPLVVGTTGHGVEGEERIRKVGEQIAIVRTNNTSVGINVMLRLVELAAKMLGPEFDAEVVELHHKAKVDAPSGTALSIAEMIAKAREGESGNRELGGLVFGRNQQSGVRSAGEIGLQSVRGGDVVGEHTAYFFGRGERIEITHRATSRSILADGAIRAACWLVEKTSSGGARKGVYSMLDVIESASKG